MCSYFRKCSVVSAARAVFRNILAGIVVVLWNTSVVCSPRYSDTGLCSCRDCNLRLVRYATFVHWQSVGTCHLLWCFSEVILWSVFESGSVVNQKTRTNVYSYLLKYSSKCTVCFNIHKLCILSAIVFMHFT
jgi:hypothetical protein